MTRVRDRFVPTWTPRDADAGCHPAARKRTGMRVLVIEDDSATAQSIDLMLKSESFNVYTTDLGEGCRSRETLRLRHHPPRPQPTRYVGFRSAAVLARLQGQDPDPDPVRAR